MAQSNKNQKKAAKAVGGAAAKGSGEVRAIIPLNVGKHAYVIQGGRIEHLSTSSERFNAALGELAAAGQADKLRHEFRSLDAAHPEHGWGKVLERFEASQAS